jgi:hypothetical protein
MPDAQIRGVQAAEGGRGADKLSGDPPAIWRWRLSTDIILGIHFLHELCILSSIVCIIFFDF